MVARKGRENTPAVTMARAPPPAGAFELADSGQSGSRPSCARVVFERDSGAPPCEVLAASRPNRSAPDAGHRPHARHRGAARRLHHLPAQRRRHQHQRHRPRVRRRLVGAVGEQHPSAGGRRREVPPSSAFSCRPDGAGYSGMPFSAVVPSGVCPRTVRPRPVWLGAGHHFRHVGVQLMADYRQGFRKPWGSFFYEGGP